MTSPEAQEPAEQTAEISTEQQAKIAESQGKINGYRNAINEIADLVKAHPDTRTSKLFELTERGESDLSKIDEARAFPKIEDDTRNELTDKLNDVLPSLEASYQSASDGSSSFTTEQEALLKEVYRRALALRGALR